MSRKERKNQSVFKRSKNLVNTTAMVLEDSFDIIGMKTGDMKLSAEIDSEIHQIKELGRAEIAIAKAKAKVQAKLAKYQQHITE